MNLDKFIPLGIDCEVTSNLDGWLASIKMDGCRAVWDGERMWTRGGNTIQIPSTLRSKLPAGRRLDGEIWAGREGFYIARNAVIYGHFTPQVRYTAFDSPDTQGTWSERVKAAQAIYSDCVQYTICQDWRHANAMLYDEQSQRGDRPRLR